MNIPFTQTKGYLSWHDKIGNKTFYRDFFDISGNLICVCASVVLKTRFGKILYTPYGPVVNQNISKKQIEEVVLYLKEIAKDEGCFMVRVEDELGWLEKSEAFFKPTKKTFAKESMFQPRMEEWLDIRLTEEELMQNFSKNHRYSIRKSEKDGIRVQKIFKGLSSKFEEFYRILKETSERDGFGLQSKKYFEAIFESVDSGLLKGFLLLSEVESNINACVLVIINDNVTNFVFGGSTHYRRESGASIRLQWEAIKLAKSFGSEYYNFGGITEDGYGKPSLESLTKYKKQYGGFSKFHGVFLDLNTSIGRYFLYNLYKRFLG